MSTRLADDLVVVVRNPLASLAEAALVIAQIEYPHLRADSYLKRLDALALAARRCIDHHVERTGDRSVMGQAQAISSMLCEEEGFHGARDHYADPRNSCLNQVLDRRTGIPITLSLVYIETARRADVTVDGVSYPGHFLVRYPETEDVAGPAIIVDPFAGGARLSEAEYRILLQQQANGDIPFRRALLAPASREQIVVRMLLNLKQLYVHMRSFPQAREVAEMLVAMDPAALNELRDRGLLAYNLNDVSGALSDLQTYLKLSTMSESDEESKAERQQIWEHVKTLRRRVASLN